MAGLLLTSITSGILISRWGRYKVFPILGTALMTVGMYLLSMLGVATSHAGQLVLHVRARGRALGRRCRC